MALKMDASKSALLLIDMQNDIVKGLAPSPRRQGVVAACVQAVALARQHQVPIFFVQVLRRPDFSDLPRVLPGATFPLRRNLAEGTQGAEIIEELKPQPQDYVIQKRRTSAFYSTPLALYLRRLGVDTLIVCGIATNWGVEGTVRDAWDRDYYVVVLEDCCDALSPQE